MSCEGWIQPTAEITDRHHHTGTEPRVSLMHTKQALRHRIVFPVLPLFLLADDTASVHLLGPINSIWAVWVLRRLGKVSRMGQGGTMPLPMPPILLSGQLKRGCVWIITQLTGKETKAWASKMVLSCIITQLNMPPRHLNQSPSITCPLRVNSLPTGSTALTHFTDEDMPPPGSTHQLAV